MENDTMHESHRLRRAAAFAVAAVLIALQPGAQAAEWRPERNVEVVVGVSPGGSMDRTARDVQRLMQEKHLLPTTSVVVNKPGGGHVIAMTYTRGRKGDGHVIQVINTPLITNQLLGRSTLTYADFTQLATLFEETMAFAVPYDSRIKDGKDFIERLRKDPSSLSISISTGVGTANQIAAIQVGKAAGIDPRRMKAVSFNSAMESVLAAAGAHVDATVTTVFSILPLVDERKLRFIAVAMPKRLAGRMAQVPTWRELGIEATVGAWRAVMGPPGLTAPQIAYWDGVLSKLVATKEWRDELDRNVLTPIYRPSAEARKFMEEEHAKYKALLIEIGLAK
ncbi:MAG: tripartite tricarboxylate transporter substrate binding protein [Rhodospirillaceae bacterium]